MEKFKITTLEKVDIQPLLQLQKENLKQNLDTQTIESQGFVTFRYDDSTIEGMMELPQIIAKDDNIVIGYALTTSLAYAQFMPLMKPLADMIPTLSFKDVALKNLKSYIIGQVCVKEGYRGMGVFDALYEGHKKILGQQYDCCITEIDYENKRSLAAHKRVGFEIIYDYIEEPSQKHWAVVMLYLR